MCKTMRALLKIIFESENERQLINTFFLKIELLKQLSLIHRKMVLKMIIFRKKEFEKEMNG